MNITVLIADDHKLFRRGLIELISSEMGIEVVGESGDGHSTLRMVRKLSPDVVIMDISMPDLNGIEAARQISRDYPGTKILALSMHSDDQFVTEMLRAGANGYLLKDSAVRELVRAIRTVSNDQTYLDPHVAGTIVDTHIRSDEDGLNGASAYSVITEREREVLQLLAEGNSTKEIADKICRSVKTVETHRRNIMQKLDLHSVAELTKYAVRQGITELE